MQMQAAVDDVWGIQVTTPSCFPAVQALDMQCPRYQVNSLSCKIGRTFDLTLHRGLALNLHNHAYMHYMVMLRLPRPLHAFPLTRPALCSLRNKFQFDS